MILVTFGTCKMVFFIPVAFIPVSMILQHFVFEQLDQIKPTVFTCEHDGIIQQQMHGLLRG